MSLLTGVFNTGDNPTELNKRSFAETMLRLYPNGSTPMFSLSSMSGRSKAVSSTHGYFSKTMTYVQTASTSGDLIGATTLTLDSTAGMIADMLLYNVSTKEVVRVLTVPTSTTITVTRAFGRVAASAITTAEVFIHIGTAHDENSTRPTARQLATVHVPNYTQIFRNSWALTDTARASAAEQNYSNVGEARRDVAEFHSTDIETAIIWGQPKMTTGPSGQPAHTTQGIIDAMEQYVPANTNSAASTTTYAQLVALVEPAFQYSTNGANAKQRMGFIDNTTSSVLHGIAKIYGNVQILHGETSFGMQYDRFRFHLGEIILYIHPLLNGLNQTGTMLLVDMPALKLAYMDGRNAKVEEYGTNGKIVEDGTDGIGGSITSECAVELVNPYACAFVDGITAAA